MNLVISVQVLPNFYFKHNLAIYFYVVHISILLPSTRTKTRKKREISLHPILREGTLSLGYQSKQIL